MSIDSDDPTFDSMLNSSSRFSDYGKTVTHLSKLNESPIHKRKDNRRPTNNNNDMTTLEHDLIALTNESNQKPQGKKAVTIPSLDLTRLKQPSNQHKKPKAAPSMKLNLESLKNSKPDYHDEFMARLDEYSESWREAALREQRHK